MTEEFGRLREECLNHEVIYDGRIMRIERDSVRLPNDHISTREVLRHIGAACVVPLTDDGKVVLERQFRYPFAEVLTELPAGKLNTPEEDPREAAKRELKEETGCEAAEWIFLGWFYPAAAYCDEKIAMYLAKGITRGKRQLDEDEFLDVFTLPLEEAVEAVMRGEIPDAKTQLGLLKARQYLKTAGSR